MMEHIGDMTELCGRIFSSVQRISPRERSDEEVFGISL